MEGNANVYSMMDGSGDEARVEEREGRRDTCATAFKTPQWLSGIKFDFFNALTAQIDFYWRTKLG